MLLDFIFPRRSLTGGEGEWVTSAELSCMNTVPRIFSSSDLRARGLNSLDRVFAIGSYQESPLLKKAIHTFKYRRIPGLAEFLGSLLLHGIEEKFPLQASAVLCPVPLHFLRQYVRGFNQSELLAAFIEHHSERSKKTLLTRVRPTGHQAWRGRQERLKAMHEAFRAKKNMTIPPHIYLIDDVFTTGATLDECAKILKHAGAQCVEAIVLAYD